jgi:hypothetical protein
MPKHFGSCGDIPDFRLEALDSMIHVPSFPERLLSGNHTKNYGKSPFFMAKSTNIQGPFSIANC